MKYIITGNQGLIGRELEKRLKKEDHKKVFGLDAIPSKDKKDRTDNVEYISCVGEKHPTVDMFFHLACSCRIREYIDIPGLSIDLCNEVLQTLEYCRENKIPKYVYFSSSRVLSKEKNPYTAGKIFGEELVKSYCNCYGINYLIIRPSTVYGGLDRTNRLVNKWVTAALKKETLFCNGKADTKTLSFTHIIDFINGVMVALDGFYYENVNEINIAGEERTLFRLANIIENAVGYPIDCEEVSPETAQPQNPKVDSTRIIQLGWVPKISLEEGIKKEVARLKKELKL